MKARKTTAITLAAVMLLSLCACGKEAPIPDVSEPPVVPTEAAVIDSDRQSADAPEPDVSEPPAVPTEAAIKSEQPLKYDPKIMDKKGEAYLGELLPLYESCVDAIVAYEPSVSGFECFEDFEKVWQVLWIAFYPSSALLIQSFSENETPYVFEGDTVTFNFKNGDKASHDEAYNAFADVINEGLSLIRADDDDWTRLARLFRYAHMSMEYREAPVTMYAHITDHVGVCADYAEYFALLVRNAGFDAMICNETGLPEPQWHAWTLVEADGNWYHFDPCWGSVREFGMSTQTRLDSLKTLVPDMPREEFDAVVKLSGDSWFDASEAFPDCPEDAPANVTEKLVDIIEP